jgi:hypothetical protein
MKHSLLIVLASLIGFYACAAEKPTVVHTSPGLVAHYFADGTNWNGAWPDEVSVPAADPSDSTFTKYEYSRVEPVINHLFIRKGWFSVRWTGYFDPGISVTPAPAVVRGRININPNNSDQNEFALVLDSGQVITRDNLKKRRFTGHLGSARSVHVKPKGNGNQNGLTVDGIPYPISNADTCDISSTNMTVRLYHEKDKADGKGLEAWWIEIAAEDATISRGADAPAVPTRAPVPAPEAANEDPEFIFQVFADDGCRLFLDGKAIIDDWRACSEELPEASRTAEPVKLANGKHRIVVEYFQGQSLKDKDHDPIVVYWSCPSRNIQRQIVPATALSHGEGDTSSSER